MGPCPIMRVSLDTGVTRGQPGVGIQRNGLFSPHPFGHAPIMTPRFPVVTGTADPGAVRRSSAACRCNMSRVGCGPFTRWVTRRLGSVSGEGLRFGGWRAQEASERWRVGSVFVSSRCALRGGYPGDPRSGRLRRIEECSLSGPSSPVPTPCTREPLRHPGCGRPGRSSR